MFMHIYEIHTDREFLYFVFLNVSAEGNRFSHITPRWNRLATPMQIVWAAPGHSKAQVRLMN